MSEEAKKTHLRGGLRRIPRAEAPASAFMDLAWDEDWYIASRTLENREQGVSYELIYEDPAQSSWIYFVDDLLVDICYVTSYGPAQQAIADVVSQRLNAWTDDELFASWDGASSIEDAARALLHLGVAQPPQFSEPFFQRLKDGLDHSDDDVRRAAVVAVGYRGWAPFKPVLTELETSDPDGDVRERCRFLLDRWEEHAEQG